MCNNHKQVDQSTIDAFLESLNFRTPKQLRNVNVSSSAITTYFEYFSGQAENHANAFVSGDIDQGEWLNRMEAELYNLHFTMYAIGAGGTDNLTASDIAEINQIVNEQAVYLRRWAVQLRRDDRPEERQIEIIRNRAEKYGREASSNTVSIAEARALGLPKLPFNPADRTLCWDACKCKWDIRALEGDGNYDCRWQLGVAEHCEVCIERSRVAQPLRVRDGVIVDAQKYQNPKLYREYYNTLDWYRR